MANLTYENFGHVVSNPKSFNRPLMCLNKEETVCEDQFEVHPKCKSNPHTADDINHEEEPKNEKGFWNAILRASLALEKAVPNPDKGWMVYK